MQAAEIADQNGAKKCGKDYELVFLARAIKEGRRRRLQMWLGLNKTSLEIGLLLLLLRSRTH